jgi:hypothetical protein
VGVGGTTGHFLGILDQLQPAIEEKIVKLLKISGEAIVCYIT